MIQETKAYIYTPKNKDKRNWGYYVHRAMVQFDTDKENRELEYLRIKQLFQAESVYYLKSVNQLLIHL